MNLLSMAGGGFMGIGPAAFLTKYESAISGPSVGRERPFRAVAGTSVGAINAAMLACGYPAKELLALHEQEGLDIFGTTPWNYRLFKKGPRFDDAHVNALLKRKLPGRMGDVKIPLFITAYNHRTSDLKVFSSIDPKDADVPVWWAVRASMAAPTYFAPWGDYWDGGLAANDPAFVGLSALRKAGDLDARVCDMVTSGSNPARKPPQKDWFITTTLSEAIIPAVTKGNSSDVGYFCDTWTLDALRVAPECKDYDLADVDKSCEVKEIWEREWSYMETRFQEWARK